MKRNLDSLEFYIVGGRGLSSLINTRFLFFKLLLIGNILTKLKCMTVK